MRQNQIVAGVLSGLGLFLRFSQPVHAATSVGYFTDYNSTDTSPAAAIVAAGCTPVAINNISSFKFSATGIVMIDEANNGGISPTLLARESDLTSYVNAGGVAVIHDRYAGNNQMIPGGADIALSRALGNDLQIVTAGNLVINGLAGTITNTNLDNGNSSVHGYASATSLPLGSIVFLSAGTNAAQAAAFSFPLGSGRVYYSTIPLDYFLDGGAPAAFRTVYAPNVLAYARVSLPDPSQFLPLASAGLLLRRRRIN